MDRTGPVPGDFAADLHGGRAPSVKAPHQGGHPGEEGPGRQREKKGSRGGRPGCHDADLCKERNAVGRPINRLRDWRGITTRFDKTPESHLAGANSAPR